MLSIKPIMKYSLAIIFSLIVQLLCGQTINIKGIITNENNKAILFANIKNDKINYSTNNFGAFTIRANWGDTLLINAISYQSIIIPIYFNTDTLLRIVMKRQKVNHFVEREFANRDSFARLAVHSLKTNQLLNNYDKIIYWPGKKTEFIINPIRILGGGIILNGLISSLWYKYSDRGKEMQKTLHLLDLYKQATKASERLNIEYIINGLKCSEEKAKKTLETCKLSNDFIIKANDYDLINALKECVENQ